MSENTSRQAVHQMIDNLSDTKSWADLAKELDKYVAKEGSDAAPNNGETIEMADLLKSLDEQDDKQAD